MQPISKLLCLFLLICLHYDPAPLRFSKAAAAGVEALASQNSADFDYDFIVVGGGSTGSIVAARLAQAQAGWRVLLLEAGGTTQAELGGNEVRPAWKQLLQELESNQSSSSTATLPLPTVFDVPLEWLTVLDSPSISHRFEWSLPDADPKVAVARGLGGCSIHNAMIYVRGIPEDFDTEQENANGARWPKEFSFQHVLPFYQRTVSQQDVFLASMSQHAPSSLPEVSIGPLHRGGEVFLSSLHPDDVDEFSRTVLRCWSNSTSNSSLPRLQDMNDPDRQEGVGLYQFLIRDGRRDTAAQELFGMSATEEEGNNANNGGLLHVRTNVQATRLLFEPDSMTGLPRARGVEVVVFRPDSYSIHPDRRGRTSSPPHSAPFVVRARHEIIISAGAVNTPSLLLHSGIGPEAQLSLGNIEAISNLKGVGANLMDGAKVTLSFHAGKASRPMLQLCSFGKVRSLSNGTRAEPDADKKWCDEQRLKWIKGQRAAMDRNSAAGDESSSATSPPPPPISFGAFGSPGFSVGAFFRSSPNKKMANVQATVLPFDTTGKLHADAGNQGVVSVELILNQPKSRGSVTLRPRETLNETAWSSAFTPHVSRSSSSNSVAALAMARAAAVESERLSFALSPPMVHVGSFDSREDVEDMVAAIRRVRELMKAEGLEEHVGEEILPGAELNEEELADFVRCGPQQFREIGVCHTSQRMVGHLAGTARIGPRLHAIESIEPSEDDGSVVDTRFRVHGVLSLRVADASVIPVLPSGNTHATCQMIGERAASMLIEQYTLLQEKEVNVGKFDKRARRSSHHSEHVRASSVPSRRDDDDDRAPTIRDMECPTPWGRCHIASIVSEHDRYRSSDDSSEEDGASSTHQQQMSSWHARHRPVDLTDDYEHKKLKLAKPRPDDSSSSSSSHHSHHSKHERGPDVSPKEAAQQSEFPSAHSASGILLILLGVVMTGLMLFLIRHVNQQHRIDVEEPLLEKQKKEQQKKAQSLRSQRWM
jgi:choline dehydrogenase-like flavoprotein